MLSALLPGAPVAAQAGTGSDNISHVDLIAYGKLTSAPRTNYGTDSDFIEMAVPTLDDAGKPVLDADDNPVTELRQIGVFGTYANGAFIMDVTDGTPVQLGHYLCSIAQGDVQVFQQQVDGTSRTYFAFTDDGIGTGRGQYVGDLNGLPTCNDWAEKNNVNLGNGQGTFFADITDPRDPQTVSFLSAPRGTHNATVHPSGDWFYNSNSELIANAPNAGIEVYDISDIFNPQQVTTLTLPIRPGLGTDSHDVTFNTEGTRAYSAALSQTVIINTENPGAPSIISSFVDPMINVEHQANPITIDDPILGERDFLIVEDELAGAAGAEPACPSGGVHVYDITGERENTPVKVGFWNISTVMPTAVLGSCTAHVFQLHEEAQLMTISFYNAGVRVVDISGLVGVALGNEGVGMREIGFHYFPNSNSWSVKAPFIEMDADGSLDFHMYSNDVNRGLDTYPFQGNVSDSTGLDVFMTATEALANLPRATVGSDYRPFCLLGDASAESAVVPALPLPTTGLSKLLGG
ncbi:hypothetical protein BH23ACT9_BH23ACT9_37500 [soil metagenome]